MTLTPEVFAILGALVEERAGLRYGPHDLDLFAAKLSTRVAEAGFDSFLDYYYFLRYDPDGARELEKVVEALVVHESYLFRERDQMEVLVETIILPAVAEGRRMRVWSAACANGEEPYTLAMMLDAEGVLDRVSILATDLSASAVARARAGELGRRALREVADSALVARWISETPDGPRVAERLREAIEFRQLNLLDDAAVRGLGELDVILCRNVLIYFSDATMRAVVDRLVSALRPDGTLWVGVSESLLRIGTSLVCEERRGAFFYRKARR